MKSPGKIIETQADVDEGADWLAARDPALAKAYTIAGQLPLRRKPEGFAELVHAIVAQPVSVASAAAMSAKVAEAGLLTPEAVLATPDADMRAIGLTRQKVRYIRALAKAGIDYDALRTLPDREAIKVLTSVTGIGVWTAEIYLMFSLGRADVLAAGDLAIQEAVRLVYGLEARPSERELRVMAEAWRPWRAVAGRLFWAYYMAQRNWEGPW
ncbi:MAG: DNA-3-methyladenine glycosylase 2 family protein [Pseudomonadota bacterium]